MSGLITTQELSQDLKSKIDELDTKVSKSGDNMTGELTINANKVWHAGNDGAGSGLDADMLQGKKPVDFVNSISISNTEDPDYTEKPFIITNHTSTPLGGAGVYWYVRTYFLNTTKSSKAQIAMRYSGANPQMFIRYKIDTQLWEKWKEVFTEDSGVNAIASSNVTLDPNTTTIPLIVSNHTNTPDKGVRHWYIQTLYYGNKDRSKGQIAIKYATGNPEMYIRYKYFEDTNWNPWTKLLTENDTSIGSWQKITEINLDASVLNAIKIQIPSWCEDIKLVGSNLRATENVSRTLQLRFLDTNNSKIYCNSMQVTSGRDPSTNTADYIDLYDVIVSNAFETDRKGAFTVNAWGMGNNSPSFQFKTQSSHHSSGGIYEYTGMGRNTLKSIELAFIGSSATLPNFSVATGKITLYGRRYS